MMTPPHDEAAEVAVIGAVLLTPDALDDARAEGVVAEDFYREAHRHIWRSVERVAASGCAPDVVTVVSDLQSEGVLRAVGGMAYLAQISAQVPTSANAGSYARIVHHHATARAAIALLGEGRAELARDPRAVTDRIAELGGRLTGLAQQAQKKKTRSARDVWRLTITALEESGERGGMAGAPSGLEPWDRLTRGLYPGRQHILAGRPGMGKSALAAWTVQRFCDRLRATPWRRVLVVSAEMTAEELGQRWACIRTMRTREELAEMEGAGMARLMQLMPELMTYPLEVVDDDRITPADIDAACREVMLIAEAEAAKARARDIDATAGIDLIVVDYLTRLEPPRDRQQRRVEIDDTVQALSAIAKRYDAPMLTLAQLSRAVEQRADKRPQLADLRETGTIEQEAYTVTALYRGDYYEDDNAVPGGVEVIVLKNRGGRTGTGHARCDLARSAFFSMSDRDDPRTPAPRPAPRGPSPEQRPRSSAREAWVMPPPTKTAPTPTPAPPSPPLPTEAQAIHTTRGGQIPESPF